MGWLADRFGRHHVLKAAGGVAFVAIGATLTALLVPHNKYAMLCVALALWGITQVLDMGTAQEQPQQTDLNAEHQSLVRQVSMPCCMSLCNAKCVLSYTKAIILL